MQSQSLTVTFRAFTGLLFGLALASCSALGPRPTPTPPATAVVPQFNTSTPVPSLTLAPTLTPTPGVTLARASYQLAVRVDYDRHFVSVDQVIVYPNKSGQALDRLVLAVVPNLWLNAFTLESLSVAEAPVTDYVLEGQRLEVPLASPLAPDALIRVAMRYTLALPAAVQEDPNDARPRIFGFTPTQTNLTNWYPFIVPYINGEWVLHDPWYYGEHLVYEAADFDVTLTFTDPANPPVVASSGFPEPGADSTRYTLTAGRAFAFSMSREFKVATQQFGDVTVSSYYFPFNENGGRAALDTAGKALQIFSERFGPYTHRSLAVVMADFDDGMEFSAFFYLSRGFYNLYTNSTDMVNYLIFVAAHETAHQWWFDMVASDQALQPWVDEALCTYSERLFYESAYPDLVSKWWAYRVDFFQPQGFVDIPVYEGQGFRPYTNAVYFRGAHFLEDLRARLGDDIFFTFLRDYLSAKRGGIATAADFFSMLRSHTQADYSDLIRQYFQNLY